MNSIFQDFARPDEASEALVAGNFVPAVDVYEDAQKLVLKLEVPGIRREDLDIRVEGRTLTVKGERKFESGGEGRELPPHRAPLWELCAQLHAAADGEHGEGGGDRRGWRAELQLAKKPEAKPKQIQVKVAPAAPKQVEANAKA